jgi:hypothetical protein
MSNEVTATNEQAPGHQMNPFPWEVERDFYQYQVDNPYRLRLSADSAMDIKGWLLHSDRKASTKEESSRRGWALANFRFDVGGRSGLYKRQLNARIREERWLKCIGSADVFKTVADMHEAMSHAGQKKTWEALSPLYYGIAREECDWVISHCLVCQATAANKSRGPLEPIITTRLFERIQIDLIDFRKEPDGQYKWICHIKDHFSKFSKLYVLKSKEAKEVAAALADWICTFGIPEITQCDNGKEFKGLCLALIRKYGIKLINGKPRCPRTQGLVEQGNGTVKARLTKWKRSTGRYDWSASLPEIAMSINQTVQESIKRMPYEVVFQRSINREKSGTLIPPLQREAVASQLEDELLSDFEIDDSDTEESEDENEGDESMHTANEDIPIDPRLLELQNQMVSETENPIHNSVRHNLNTSRVRMKRRYGKAHRIEVFGVGDIVTVSINRLDRAATDDNRLFAKVIQVPKENRYQLVSVHGVLENLYSVSELNRVPDAAAEALNRLMAWNNDQTCTLHAAAAANSTADRVPLSCSCRTTCNRRCVCVKNDKSCSVYCHTVEDLECGNLSQLQERTEEQTRKRKRTEPEKATRASKSKRQATTKLKGAQNPKKVATTKLGKAQKSKKQAIKMIGRATRSKNRRETSPESSNYVSSRLHSRK